MSDRTSSRVLSASNAPIFFSFFTWGFGTGAQNLGRPLFALALTGNVFLVGVLLAVNAIPRLFAGPLTGYLTDRIGRKPLVMLAPAIRGATNFGQFFATDYVTFLVLELIGQVGVAMWATSSTVLFSDLTTTSNRGRVLALRQMSMRLGFVAGPLAGGVLAAVYGLPSVFLLNGITKVVIVLVVLFMVRETRPDAPVREDAARGRRVGSFSLSPFRDRAFLVLALATAGAAVAQAGVMQTLVPVHAKIALGADDAAVGFLLSLSALMAFAAAFPNGIVLDRFGRKVSLVPGLLLLGAAAFTLVFGIYGALIAAVVLQGTGGAMTMAATHTYVMDLAPPENRGSFIGLWTTAQSGGAIAGPLVVGALYEFVTPAAAFASVGVLLVVSAVLMAAYGRETAGPRRAVEEPIE